jgi:hypothetical protein
MLILTHAFSKGHDQLAIALPNGNADEELPWLGKWSVRNNHCESFVGKGLVCTPYQNCWPTHLPYDPRRN